MRCKRMYVNVPEVDNLERWRNFKWIKKTNKQRNMFCRFEISNVCLWWHCVLHVLNVVYVQCCWLCQWISFFFFFDFLQPEENPCTFQIRFIKWKLQTYILFWYMSLHDMGKEMTPINRMRTTKSHLYLKHFNQLSENDKWVFHVFNRISK